MVAKKKSYNLKLRNLKLNTTANHINQPENKSKAIWNAFNTEKQGKQKKGFNILLEIEGRTKIVQLKSLNT